MFVCCLLCVVTSAAGRDGGFEQLNKDESPMDL